MTAPVPASKPPMTSLPPTAAMAGRPAGSFDSRDGRTYSGPVTATPGQDSCGCPETDGKIYHQRGTCTDPVAARLDWYADGPAPAAAATPGQAAGVDPTTTAYRVHAHAFNTLTERLAHDDKFVPLSERDAIASAIVEAIEPIIRADERAVAAQEPHAAPELAAAMRETRELRELFDKATTAIMTRRWALTEPEKRIIAGFRQQAGLTS